MSTDNAALAAQVAELAKQNKEMMESLKQTDNWKKGVEEAVIGKKTDPEDPNAVVFNRLVTDGAKTLEEVRRAAAQDAIATIRQENLNNAYIESLQKDFEKKNPSLASYKPEVFATATSIIKQGAAQGKKITDEDALAEATKIYQEKANSYAKIGGLTATPGGHGGFQEANNRYAGCETDYFSMDDKEFGQVFKAKENARKANQRRFGR